MKKVVGIVPTARLFQNEDLYSDNYTFVNSYIKRIKESGGIPIGILSEDGYAIEEELDLCDSFLICGGSRIYPYHFQVVDYAVRNKRPLLGICLGMQVICTYFKVLEEGRKRKLDGSLLELYEQMKRERHMFTIPVEHHWDVPMTRYNIEETKHRIHVKNDTRLYNLIDCDTIMAATMHKYGVNGVPECVLVSAKAGDGTIEAIEYDKFIMGVQFHPEVENHFDMLFKTLTM